MILKLFLNKIEQVFWQRLDKIHPSTLLLKNKRITRTHLHTN